VILQEIIEHKRDEIAGRMEETPLEDIRRQAESAPPVRGFADALRLDGQGRRRSALRAGNPLTDSPPVPRLIAEIKGRSPSKGTIRKVVDAAAIATDYAGGGASCISVLTDMRFFAGALERIAEVRDAVDLPVLQKDFVIDPYQVFEARAIGADCILLIVAGLPQPLLRELYELSRSLSLDVLVETHSREEMDVALGMGARLVGINNRDLNTFDVSLATTEQVAPMVPEDCVLIGESGIHTRDDLTRLAAAGVDGVLIGEAFMASPDIPSRMRELFG